MNQKSSFATLLFFGRSATFAATVLITSFVILASTATPGRVRADGPGPNPNDDWILSAPNVETPNDAGVDADPSIVLSQVATAGRIVRVDESGIETEDRRTDSTKRFERTPGGAILFLPTGEPNEAARFCNTIQNRRGNLDYIWLRNGDEFAGTLRSVDRRRVVFRAFDVDVAVPRGRVRAVRFADAASDER